VGNLSNYMEPRKRGFTDPVAPVSELATWLDFPVQAQPDYWDLLEVFAISPVVRIISGLRGWFDTKSLLFWCSHSSATRSRVFHMRKRP
jgi:hypothetical protein